MVPQIHLAMDTMKVNILFIISSPSGGGAERNSVSLANLFKKNGYNVSIVCTESINDDYGLFSDIPLLYIPYKDPKRYSKLLEVTRKFKVDIVVLTNHWRTENFNDIYWFKAQNIKIIAQEHSMFFFPLYVNNFSLFTERLKAYKIVDILTCLSKMDAYLWQISGIQQVRYVPNLAPRLSNNCKLLDFKSRDNSIVIVGKFSEIKGLYNLPSYLEAVHKLSPTTEFYLFGNFGSKIEKFWFFRELKKRKIKNFVFWHGFTPNVIQFIRRAKFLFISSQIEGSPMVILEARQNGTPCLMFDLNYIDNALHGVLHICSKDDFVKKVELLLNNEEFWTKFFNDTQFDLKDWEEDSVIKIWENLFSQIQAQFNERSGQTIQRSEEEQAMQEFYRAMDFTAATSQRNWSRFKKFPSLLNFIRLIKGIKAFIKS